MPKVGVYASYVGDGNYVPGVPARDMTKAEWEALPEEKADKALASKTHKIVAGGKASKKEVSDGTASK